MTRFALDAIDSISGPSGSGGGPGWLSMLGDGQPLSTSNLLNTKQGLVKRDLSITAQLAIDQAYRNTLRGVINSLST